MLNGYCDRRQTSCTFAHGEEEMVNRESYKTQMCRNVDSDRGTINCKMGVTCHFAHSRYDGCTMGTWLYAGNFIFCAASFFFNTSFKGLLHLQFGCAFTVECVFYVIFEFSSLKITLKTHSTVKRTPKLHTQNASVINPLRVDCTFSLDARFTVECVFDVIFEFSTMKMT
jgi:hypothetical protein